jgi:diguanylate cyclase (GGDEF)-like protein/PAS domain S-box-containing protein
MMRAVVALAAGLGAATASATAHAGNAAALARPDELLSYTLGIIAAAALLGVYATALGRRHDVRERELKTIIETAPVALIVSDKRHRIIDWNHHAEQIFGWKRNEALHRNLVDLVVPVPNRLKARRDAAAVIAGTMVTFSTDTNLTRRGGHVVCEWRHAALQDAAGKPYAMLSTAMDVTERWHMETRLKHMAHTDALTGIPNRALFFERLQHAIALTKRHSSNLAILFVDLDRFKTVNDTHGHEAGDAVLCAVAQRLRDQVRQSDTVARIGGDEFVVLLNDVGSNAAIDMMTDKIAAEVARPIEWNGLELRVGASIGIARYLADGSDAESLVRAADRAMYSRKKLQLIAISA